MNWIFIYIDKIKVVFLDTFIEIEIENGKNLIIRNEK